MSDFDNFTTSTEDFIGEKELRSEQNAKLIKFGIPYFDDCMGGLLPSDLLLLGAKSGAGKTEVATLIAESAVRQGKRVAFYALEAERKENTWRRFYRRLSHYYFSDPNRQRASISYHDWRMGLLDSVFSSYYEAAKREIEDEDKKNYVIRYREGEDFTIENFQREIASLKNFDLIIIDHFHFFDLDPGPENEAQKKITKQLRDLVYEYKIPIVLIAHLRKTDRRFNAPMPDMEDFMGSSDLYKIATKCVLLSSGGKVESGSGRSLWATYMHVAKLRTEGSRTRFIGKSLFDTSTTSYRPQYRLGNFTQDKGIHVWKDLYGHELPSWAKGAERLDVMDV